MFPLPKKEGDDQGQIENGIRGKGGHGAKSSHDDAADCRAEAARHIVADGTKGNRRGQMLAAHLLADRRLPSRAKQRDACADQETK